MVQFAMNLDCLTPHVLMYAHMTPWGLTGFFSLGMIPNLLVTQNVTLCLQNGFSPVYGASEYGHTDVVDLLVQAGADIHLAAPEVYTLIHTVSSSAVIVVVNLCQTD